MFSARQNTTRSSPKSTVHTYRWFSKSGPLLNNCPTCQPDSCSPAACSFSDPNNGCFCAINRLLQSTAVSCAPPIRTFNRRPLFPSEKKKPSGNCDRER
ncbi:predicted protein [Plenodomus lingam JN3]|uniref:Predicted protein n=1 Tax=Leptosphaeria maculans (strain JN3 / isolate v23.1.3 / race Av1-4-5-6-7-8) TaxID=985895 RepID=E5AA77_LEPMJ|nr:predicted protein [Plenodomus lingam JN3]CBY00568.1 predicted protein [Plenodomus lingam JN3]